MPTSGPDDYDDNGDPESNPQRDAWLFARNLSIGDVIQVNEEVVMEIVQINQYGSAIEYFGELHSGNEKWRILRLEFTHYGSIAMYNSEKTNRTAVSDISPKGGTILSLATADSHLPGDVTGEDIVDPYVEKRDQGVEFSKDVSVVGDCPCGGDIGKLDLKVVCESCGRWVPTEVWDEWSTANPDKIQNDSPSDSITEGDGSGNRSLGDFM